MPKPLLTRAGTWLVSQSTLHFWHNVIALCCVYVSKFCSFAKINGNIMHRLFMGGSVHYPSTEHGGSSMELPLLSLRSIATKVHCWLPADDAGSTSLVTSLLTRLKMHHVNASEFGIGASELCARNRCRLTVPKEQHIHTKAGIARVERQP